MNAHHISCRMLAVVSLALALALPARAADITWNGGGDGVNWSDANNWGGTAPGSADRAIFPNQPSGLTNTVDASFGGTVQFVRIEQSTTTTTNAISLNRDLVLNSNNTAGSGLQYGAVISDPSMIQWDINGNYLRFSSTSTDHKTNDLYGTFLLDTAGSRIGTARFPGTAATDFDTFRFGRVVGTTTNRAVINVTADAQIGRITTGSTTENAQRQTTILIGAGSEVNISNNSTLTFLQRTRVASANRTTLAVTNAGTINIGAGSRMGVVFQQVNASDINGINIAFANAAGGVVHHHGTVLMGLHERGTAWISNAGEWQVGASAVLTGFVASASAGDGGSVIFTNLATGLIRGSGSSSVLDYNPGNSATFLNQKLTIISEGSVAPGDGTGGSGLTSVGTLEFRDINLTLTSSGVVRMDVGGTGSGQFDVLTLTGGVLDLSATGDTLAVTLVNGFTPTSSFSIPIINYDSRVSTFDLLTINGLTDGGTTYFAGNGTYSIFHDVNGTYLNFDLLLIPEPSTVMLFIGGLMMLWWRRRTSVA